MKSTEGHVLYDLLKDVITKMKLDISKIVAECFDGAANMSGVHKGLATLTKETTPMSIYIHCYGHLINLAIQDTMENVTTLRNALGTIRLYNFLEADPKRHNIFNDIPINDSSAEKPLLTSLKSQSVTRWACRYEAVKAVYELLEHFVKCLMKLSEDKDANKYMEARSLLTAICNFEFLFGLCVLRITLMNTSNNVQGKSIDIITTRNNANMTVQTLKKCRSDQHHQNLWDLVMNISDKVKCWVNESSFVDFFRSICPEATEDSL